MQASCPRKICRAYVRSTGGRDPLAVARTSHKGSDSDRDSSGDSVAHYILASLESRWLSSFFEFKFNTDQSINCSNRRAVVAGASQSFNQR